MIPGFSYNPRSLEYDFGPHHPLRPIRLSRTIAALQALDPTLEILDAPDASIKDLRHVHSAEYIEAVKRASTGSICQDEWARFGFTRSDTPPFIGIYESALAYTGATVRAATQICNGAERAFNLSGGLHHAMAGRAGGFCVFNDVAIACAILKLRFERVMYVDIDLHHGDGVQSIFAADPDVMTLSIHESGRTLYPGTGFETERGAGNSVVNIPLLAGTDGLTWRWAFGQVFELACRSFRPQAIVLQMGCDAHRNDPLGHLECRVEDWLGAVKLVHDRGLPTVATGGGGYALENVPRMWAAATLLLSGIEVPDRMPDSIPVEWGCTSIFDGGPEPNPFGRGHAEEMVRYWENNLG